MIESPTWYSLSLQSLGQILAVEDIGQLGLAVRLGSCPALGRNSNSQIYVQTEVSHCIVYLFMVQVIPVHLAELVPHGRYIDYPRPKPRRCRFPQQGQQTLGQQEVPKVVSLPRHLKPVLCHGPVPRISSVFPWICYITYGMLRQHCSQGYHLLNCKCECCFMFS